ncbi:alpha/beta hydrolase [Pseudonocardia alni]|jgi:putative tributyrin esterase|uniref:S-formylglutathione hydrolase FrmB n=2 Tax=Pseudonocardia alni TaxID=33907 RepID=A0A852W4J9_PSEA5|nr:MULTISPECIES: alpha/beta hydrolase family protein [Pseudonocardia]OJG06020.1 Diacylglycerol acyltransferase/mycolyltransferase Ag85A precursor [Pseudonocardia autotrophica]MCM3848254.1 esterase family protein [Pseudonocardia sp. DR1-2]MCO7191742.1 esterase family protein [Pseudonocardia sp. McavD-2-B]MYW75127.1 alpha/beta hydrolase fold domain-containing protein [Pseudonocardia sp. SID8383]NYG01704.1 S-formylglutathione hydrolase FrmB [Pseudonocardia antarctica]
MARLRCDVVADSLGLATSVTVLLPQPSRTRIGAGVRDLDAPPPVLYLLHGLSDDDTAWTRYTAVERYADELGLAVVMPQVHRSFYTDQAYGGRYRTWVTEELPALVARFFRVSADPAETFVAGLSMGGYGALSWALAEPGRFAAAASLSGALDLAALAAGPPREEDPRIWERILDGAPVAGTEADLSTLLARLDPAAAPALYVCAGTEDPLHPQSVRFAELARAAGVSVSTAFGPGEHEWGYWDARIRDVLDWLPLPR